MNKLERHVEVKVAVRGLMVQQAKLKGALKKIFLLSLLLHSVSCSLRLDLDSLNLLKKTPPVTISDDLPPINNTNEKNFEIVGSCNSEISSFEITIGGKTEVVQCKDGTWKVEVDISDLPDGVIEVITNIRDPKTGELIAIEISKDTKKPVITNIVLNSGRTLTNQLQIPYEVLGTKVFETYMTEDSTCETGGSWQKTSPKLTITATEGAKTLYLLVRDSIGNISNCEKVEPLAGHSISLDQTPPVVTGLSDDAVIAKVKTWSWGCDDANKPCAYRYSITKGSSADPLGVFDNLNQATQSTGDGVYFVNVQAQDAAGNISETASAQVVLDNTRPTLSLTTTMSEPFNASKFDVTARFSEAVSGFEVSDIVVTDGVVSNFAGTEDLYTFTVNPDTSNSSLVTISVAENKAHDDAGNGNVASTLSRTYDENYSLGSIVISNPTLVTGDYSTEFEWTITYNDSASISLSETDITPIATGSVVCSHKSVSGIGNTRKVTLKDCKGLGTVQFHLAKGTALDIHGNSFAANTSAGAVNVTNVIPAITIESPTPLQGDDTKTFTWNVKISDATSVSITPSNVVLIGDSEGCQVAVSTTDISNHAIKVSQCADMGVLSVSLPAGVAQGPGGDSLATGPSKTVALTNSILVSFAEITSRVNKNSTGTSLQTFGVTLSKAYPKDIEIFYNPLGRHTTAVNPNDYNLSSSSIQIPAGQTSGNISYTYNDGTTAGSKAIQLALSKASAKVVTLDKAVAQKVVSDPTSEKIKLVSVGGNHTCGLQEGGALFCWGKNDFGQLGNSSTASSRVPVLVHDGDTYTSVSAGDAHTCGIQAGGALFCWGKNDSGQLGNNSIASSNVPVLVHGGDTYTSVSAGSNHTCGIKASGALFCWGKNDSGQLGNSSTASSNVPVLVHGGGTYISVSAGDAHTCGIQAGGDLYCWGNNLNGQLGDNSDTSSNIPKKIGSSYTSVSAGGNHTCGIITNANLFCWGNNSNGQLGNSSTESSNVPMWAHSGQYTSVSAGITHTCGIRTTGALYCWGNNFYGQFGNSSTTSSNVPVLVHVGRTYVSVSVSNSYGCGVHTVGDLFCWGRNEIDRQGGTTDSSITSSNVPVPVSVHGSSSGYVHVSPGGNHTCGIQGDGTLFCWGENFFNSQDYGQLGNNLKTPSSVPVPVHGGGKYLGVSAGGSHTCGIQEGGNLYCWGYNYHGQLGNKSTISSNVPVAVHGGDTYTSVSAGSNHTCGIKASGALYCWGRNDFGQLGNNSIASSNVPVLVHGGGKYLSVSAGGNHTCGIQEGGDLFCWGINLNGRLGNSSTVSSNVPVLVHGGGKYLGVSAGNAHTCGIKASGDLFCWGNNLNGQFGDNSTTSSNVPVLVHGGGTYISVSAGDAHTCGLQEGGDLFCWGRNFKGQLGDHSTTSSNVPVAVHGGGKYLSVSAGGNHTCGIQAGGDLTCWGNNSSGQLGEGSLFLVPTFVPPPLK